jgi:hypothetical protein
MKSVVVVLMEPMDHILYLHVLTSACFTVDINPETKLDLVGDAQTLVGIPNNKFNRWRCDPPYNQNTALKMCGY